METSKIEKTMSAAAFAEAGEFDTAKEMLGDDAKKSPAMGRQPVKKKPFLPTLVFGAISLSAYVILFKNERLVTETFTMGGWSTVYPVATAFFFSFIHGAFASNLLSVLNLEAKK